MDPYSIYIKNMVCNRCIMVVKELLERLAVNPVSIKLGEVVLPEKPAESLMDTLREELTSLGFEIIDNKRVRLIEQVKSAVIELVHYHNNNLKLNLSEYISDKVHYDYTYVSNLFSEIENTTIEKYVIAQKIERVKELLVYDELTLNEIADMMNYSSVAHLSSQFKKVTGLTPSHFKQVKEKKRKPLDEVK